MTSLRTEAPPRFRSIPVGATSTWGNEAIAFAADIDLVLDAGQADLLTDGMSLRANGLWLSQAVVDVEPRQNGKTMAFEVRALAGLYVLQEPLIIWTAHEFKTARQSFETMQGYVTNWDHLRKRVKSIRNSGAVTEIELMNPRRKIVFLARSGGSGRGFAKATPLIMDEAYALTPEHVAAITFAKSVAPNPQVWYGSSAPLENSAVLRDLIIDGRADTGGAVYYEWSAAGTAAGLERLVTGLKRQRQAHPDWPQLMELVAQANRAFPRRLTEETIADEVKNIPVPQFVRERLGVFSELEEGGKIDPEKWITLGDPDSRRDGDCSLAVDISIERDWAAIGMYAKRADGHGHVQLIHYQERTAGLLDKLDTYRDALQPVAIGMARGTYAALKDELKLRGYQRPEERPVEIVRNEGQSTHPPRRGDLIILNGTDMAAATGGFLDGVRHGTIRHVPTDQLLAMVKVAQTRTVGDAMTWIKTDQAVDITGLVAVTEAKWSHEARVNEIEDYDPTADIF